MKINSISGVNNQVKIGERPIEVEPYKPQRPVTKTEKLKTEGKKIDDAGREVRDVKETKDSKDIRDVKESKETNEEFNDELLKKSVEQANKTLEMYHRRIDRTVHEVTKTVIYTIRDTETNEVIQEFPPRKIQDMIAKMWELAGLFVDERA